MFIIYLPYISTKSFSNIRFTSKYKYNDYLYLYSIRELSNFNTVFYIPKREDNST